MLLFRLTIANLKMILRNRQALFWALAFPVVMLGIFGIVGGFRNTTVTVGVVDYANDALSERLIRSLSDLPVFDVEVREDEEAARNEVRDGDLGYLLLIPVGTGITGPKRTSGIAEARLRRRSAGRLSCCCDRTIPRPDEPGAGGSVSAPHTPARRSLFSQQGRQPH